MRRIRDRSRKEKSLWNPYQRLQDEKEGPITSTERREENQGEATERVQEGNADAAGMKAVRSQGK